MRHLTLFVRLLAIAFLVLTCSNYCFAMNAAAHQEVTAKSFTWLGMAEPEPYRAISGLNGTCSEIRGIRVRPSSFSSQGAVPRVTAEVPAVDDYRDLEFVDVEGAPIGGDGGRDNPHKDDWLAVDDKAKTAQGTMSFTAFNHFIDIKKGPGLFDDYDGYSYKKGSAHSDQYQMGTELASGWKEKLAAGTSKYKVDEGVSWWMNDEYIHVLGQPWYSNCSASTERYSFPADKGQYAGVKEELAARFPLATATGGSDKGFPYSVFMPLDNMARYWYGRFTATKDPLALAPVLHAIQDASIPHHSAGCLGNWHSRYEDDLGAKVRGWLGDDTYIMEVRQLVIDWSKEDSAPPTGLTLDDASKKPGINWPVDQLVTWLALNSYRSYKDTYGDFRRGYSFNEDDAKNLTKMAAAMTVLVLKKAAADVTPKAAPN